MQTRHKGGSYPRVIPHRALDPTAHSAWFLNWMAACQFNQTSVWSITYMRCSRRGRREEGTVPEVRVRKHHRHNCPLSCAVSSALNHGQPYLQVSALGCRVDHSSHSFSRYFPVCLCNVFVSVPVTWACLFSSVLVSSHPLYHPLQSPCPVRWNLLLFWEWRCDSDHDTDQQ